MSDHASNERDDLPRQVDLAIVRVDPWGVMKVAFLLSVALGIALVVAVVILWLMLNAMHVFASAESFLQDIGASQMVSLLDYVRLPKVMAYTTLIAVMNVVLLTALSALGTFLYNLVASLVGGIKVTLMDE